ALDAEAISDDVPLLAVEALDAMIVGVGHVDPAAAVDDHAAGEVELPGLGALAALAGDQRPALAVEHGDAVVQRIGHIDELLDGLRRGRRRLGRGGGWQRRWHRLDRRGGGRRWLRRSEEHTSE